MNSLQDMQKRIKNTYPVLKTYILKFVSNKLTSNKRHVLVSLIGTIIILLIIFHKPGMVEAGWWDDTWHYRKSISVGSGSAAATDYQVMINNYDTASDITAGKMQSDCGDIRFTSENGVPLDYWIEEDTCNTSTTNIWVKIDLIPTTGGTTIYMYYGNPSAEDGSDGDKVFQFFDDFDDDSGLWTKTGTITYSNGIATIGSGTNTSSLAGPETFGTNTSLKFKIQLLDDTDHRVFGWLNTDWTNRAYYSGYSDNMYTRGSGTSETTAYNYLASTWYTDEIIRNDTTSVIYKEGGVTQATHTTAAVPTGVMQPYFYVNTAESDRIQLDWVLIRDYMATEPSVGTPGSEEKGDSPVAYWSFDEGNSTTVHNQMEENGEDGLISWWKFDEGTGTTLNDEMDINDGTITGAAWSTSGKTGNALDFDGVDYVVVASPQFSDLDKEITISVWQYGDATLQPQDDSLLEARDSSNNRVFNIHLPWSDGIVYWDAGNSGASFDRISKVTGSASEYEGQWNHWAFTKDANTGEMKIYLNGELWHSDTGKTYSFGTISQFTIGANYTETNNYDGLIDNLKIYSRALSAFEIEAEYNSLHGHMINMETKSVTIQPGSEGIDAYIDEEAPDTNFNTNTLRIGDRLNGDGYGPYDSLFKFDLSEIKGDVLDADLTLWMYDYDYRDNDMNVYRTTSSWDEDSVTWNTKPSYDTSLIATFPSSTDRTYVEVTRDVTSTVADWVNGTNANYGFYGKGTSEADWTRARAASSDYETATYRPKLEVDYEGLGWVDGAITNEGAKPMGEAIDFDGADDYIDVSDVKTVQDTHSLSFWINPDSTTESILDLDGGTHYVQISSGTIIATGFSSPTIYVNGIVSSTVSTGEWSHVVITTATGFNSDNINIGRQGSNYFDGEIDEVKIYDFALSEDQVEVQYNRGFAQATVVGSGRGYKKLLTVSDPGTGTSDTQILLDLDTESLVNAGKLRDDCKDLSFTSLDGSEEYDYWVEGGCNSSHTAVWVDTGRTSGDYELYMCYGTKIQSSGWQDFSGDFILMSDSACTSGWNPVSALTNRFPRGNSVYGGTGGSANHTHTYSFNTADSPIGSNSGNGITGTVPVIGTHSHTMSGSVASASILPQYKNVAFCSTSVLPSSILTNYYVFAEESLSGWSTDATFNSRFPRGVTSGYGTTGGSLTHTHHYSGTTSTASTVSTLSSTSSVSSAGSHSHSYSGTTSAASNNPPYLELLFLQPDSAVQLPEKSIVMTTTAVPMGWSRYSDLDNRFPRGGATAGGTGGASTHTHTMSGTTGTCSASTVTVSVKFLPDIIGSHSHSYSGTTASASSLPPYLNTLFYQKNVDDSTVTYGTELTNGVIGSPVANWDFNRGYGTTAYDSVGDNDGTLTNMASDDWVNGAVPSDGQKPMGRSLDFDGSDDYVQVSNFDSLDLTDDFALTGWFNPSVSDNGCVMATTPNSAASAGWAVCPYVGTDNLYFLATSGGGSWDLAYIGPSVTFDIDTWYHYVITRSGTTLKMYIDGDEVYSGTNPNSFTTANDLYIDGFSNQTNMLTGNIDEVKIYDYALTADEVKVEYNRGSALVLGAGENDSDPGLSNLVGWWKMDEASGTTAYDISGGGNDGTLTNMDASTDWVQGKIGKALDFDGSDDYVSVLGGDGSDIDVGGSNFTLTAWFKTSNPSSTTMYIYDTAGYGGDQYYLRMNANDTLTFHFDPGSSIPTATTTNTFADNEWHFVVAVRTAVRSASIYVDGILEDEDSPGGSSSTIDITSNLFIGQSDSGSNHWVGQLDNLKFWRGKALSQAEVAWGYNQGAPIANWRFNEGSGTTAYDESVHDNDGTLTNMDPANDWIDGIKNGALDFDGSNDYVNIPDSPEHDFTSVTISGWFYPRTFTSGHKLLVRDDTASNRIWQIQLSGASGAVQFIAAAPTTWEYNIVSTKNLDLNKWNYVAVTVNADTDTAYIYINGQQVGTDTAAGDIISGNNPILIGGTNLANYSFDGQIDDVKIYNYALTADQVRADYNNGAVRFGE